MLSNPFTHRQIIYLWKGIESLELPEMVYPLKCRQGITIFWEKANDASEFRGELSIKRGFNFVRWVNIYPAASIRVTNMDDVISSYYCRAKNIREAITKLKREIVTKRDKFGCKLSEAEINAICREIVGIPLDYSKK